MTNMQAAVVAPAQAVMVTLHGLSRLSRVTCGFGAGRLAVVGSKLGQLEADKADAIRREDYDAAKALKSRIDRMRAGGGGEDGAPQPRRAAPQQQGGSSGSRDGGGGDAAEPAPPRRSQPRESRPSAHDERVPPAVLTSTRLLPDLVHHAACGRETRVDGAWLDAEGGCQFRGCKPVWTKSGQICGRGFCRRWAKAAAAAPRLRSIRRARSLLQKADKGQAGTAARRTQRAQHPERPSPRCAPCPQVPPPAQCCCVALSPSRTMLLLLLMLLRCRPLIASAPLTKFTIGGSMCAQMAMMQRPARLTTIDLPWGPVSMTWTVIRWQQPQQQWTRRPAARWAAPLSQPPAAVRATDAA